MATEIVKSWIYNDVKLTKQISSFETDFSNGYLFGEILLQFQQLEDLSQFSKKSNKESKISNFRQVEEILRNLKVKFDAKLVNQIMNEERGAALRLLYQLKLSLGKLSTTRENEMTMTNIKPQITQKKHQQTLELSQQLKLSGNTMLVTMNKSKKLSVIEQGQLKFEYTKKLMEDKAWQDQQNEEKLIKKLQLDARQKHLAIMDENKQFMTQWEKEGKQNWEKNQQRKQEIIDRKQYFEDKEVEQYKNKLTKILNEATGDMKGGIDDFNNNLQKLGIEQNTNIQDAIKKMEEKKGVPPGQIQNFSYAATMNKIKEKKNISDFAGKERDRRRRKLVVDQAKTQTDLKRKKNEELMIQKLLKVQEEERQIAFLDWRNQYCKELITSLRVQKANEVELKKQKYIQEEEKQRKIDADKIRVQRTQEIEQQRKQNAKYRRDEKYKKRAINVEICSEIIDLIMDVGHEAFNKLQANNKDKLDKPEWREWMKIFKEGKLVSQVINADQMSPQQSLMDEELNQQEDKQKESLTQYLNTVKSDKAYEDLMEYLSVCGSFNLSCGQYQEWNDFNKLCQPIFLSNGLESIFSVQNNFYFLSEILPPLNPELGKNIGQFYQTLFLEDKTSIKSINPAKSEVKKDMNTVESQKDLKTNEQLQILGLPHYLNIKLCLIGKSFSGKRTSAKQLNEQYFHNKLKVFRMDTLIKEAIEYITPKQVIEQVAVKGKAPVKGGKLQQEEVQVDPYQGMDTTAYKELGHQLKKVMGQSQDMLNQNTDIVNLVQDDIILVKLFAEKLKLTFPKEKSEEIKVQEMKKNIQREKEILQQLAEIEATNAIQVEQKAAKKTQPKVDKKGVSNEEQLKQELEEVTQLPHEGWILLDFPRTSNQAKLMESIMKGYTSLIDQNKQEDQEKFEQWSKLVTPSTITSEEYDGQSGVQQSAMDAVIIINVPSQECKRRSVNRKIDPTTNTIYHLEDNPPPDNDNKLKDRLQEYIDPESDASRMNINQSIFNEQEVLLKKWFTGFGHKDETVQDIKAANLLIEVNINEKIKKEEVTQRIFKQLQDVLKFKQAQYDQKKKNIVQTISSEEEQKHQSVQEVQEESKQKDEQNVVLDSQRASQYQYEQQLQVESIQDFRTGEMQDKEKRNIWDLFEESYYKDSLYVFRMIRRQRELVFEGFNDMQRRYIEFLERPDNKQDKINDFIQSFNKFSDEFPDLREDEQTKEELQNRVQTLSNELWNIIEQRKDQAINERKRVMENGWVQHEMKKSIRYSLKIIQCELNKYQTVSQILLGQNQQQFNVENVFNLLIEQGVIILSNDTKYKEKYPILANLYTEIIKFITKQGTQILQIQQQQTKQMLLIEQQNLIFRLNMIKTWLKLKLNEFYQCFEKVCDILDDWIVEAVTLENQQCESVAKYLNQAIKDEVQSLQRTQELQIDTIDFYQALQLIEFSAQMTPQYILDINKPEQSDYLVNRFKVSSLEQLYKEFRYYSYQEYLDSQTFIHLIVLCYQDGRIPQAWRFINFEKISRLTEWFQEIPLGQQDSPIFNKSEEKQIKREFVNWKKIFALFVLITCKKPSSDDLQNYIQQLQENSNGNGEIDLQQFINTQSYFDQYENRPEIQKQNTEDDYSNEENSDLDYYRLEQIKTLIFNTLKQNTDLLKIEEFKQTIIDIGKISNDDFSMNCYSDFLYSY